jgi:hypothetical protein
MGVNENTLSRIYPQGILCHPAGLSINIKPLSHAERAVLPAIDACLQAFRPSSCSAISAAMITPAGDRLFYISFTKSSGSLLYSAGMPEIGSTIVSVQLFQRDLKSMALFLERLVGEPWSKRKRAMLLIILS